MEEYILLSLIFVIALYIAVSVVQLQIIKQKIRKQIAEEVVKK